MIIQIKEYISRFFYYLSPTAQMQRDLEKRISKASKIGLASIDNNYIARCERHNTLLGLRIQVLEQNVGWFDHIFNAGKIQDLVGKAKTLQASLLQECNKTRELVQIQCNKEKQFFKNLFTEFLSYTPEKTPEAITVQSPEIVEENSPVIIEPSQEITESQPIEKIEESTEELNESDIEISQTVFDELDDPALECEELSPVSSPIEEFLEPIFHPEPVDLDQQSIPGILTNIYKFAHQFFKLPDVIDHLKRIHHFIDSYNYNGRPRDIANDEIDCLFNAWNTFYTDRKLEALCNDTSPHPLNLYVEATGSRYYVQCAIDLFNTFLANYKASPLFSPEGRKELLEVDPRKIVDYVFSEELNEDHLNTSEKFLVHLGKGFCNLVQDLIQKCKVDAYWKDWCFAYSRGPWNYPLTKGLLSEISKDPFFLKSILKNFSLKTPSYEDYVTDLYERKYTLACKTPAHLKGKSVEKASKKRQKLEEECKRINTQAGKCLYNITSYYYDAYIIKFFSRFIDYHDVTLPADFILKLFTALDVLKNDLELDKCDQLSEELKKHLKEILFVGIQALQNFLRESEAIPYERLFWNTLDKVLLAFRFEPDQPNYLQQYWERIALPLLKSLEDKIESFAWDKPNYPDYVSFGTTFLKRQFLPGYMRNNATFLHHLDQSEHINTYLTNASKYLHQFLGTSKKTFDDLFSDLFKAWNDYKLVVYGQIEKLPHFKNELFHLYGWSKLQFYDNLALMNNLYFDELLYRSYKYIPFLSADFRQQLMTINAKKFVQGVFKDNSRELSTGEEQLTTALKDAIFWIKFRVAQNKNEPGWIEYELNTAETGFEALLAKFGVSKFAFSSFLLLGKSNFLASNALKNSISYLKNSFFKTTKARQENHLKKQRHIDNPEIAKKKFDSKEGKAFNKQMDKIIDTIYIPLLKKVVDNHDISKVIASLQAWKEAFEGYKAFVKTGDEKAFDRIIAQTLYTTVNTLQNICREMSESEKFTLNCIDETLQEYSPTQTSNFTAHHFEQLTTKFFGKLFG